ncbi:MAG: FMN-binding protein [Actinomycetota bacterium]
MRRIVTAFLSTITALVLLFSYHTSTDSASVAASPAVLRGASPGSTSQARSSGGGGSSAPRKNPPAPSAATYTGGVADTQWGPVQVQITVEGGKVTASKAVQYPQGNGRDWQINSYALPILDQEAVQQQTAAIDTVSGATVTSDGYLQSLQSAIDQAHL